MQGQRWLLNWTLKKQTYIDEVQLNGGLCKYINTKDGVAYEMRPLIYDASFKHDVKITQEMT